MLGDRRHSNQFLRFFLQPVLSCIGRPAFFPASSYRPGSVVSHMGFCVVQFQCHARPLSFSRFFWFFCFWVWFIRLCATRGSCYSVFVHIYSMYFRPLRHARHQSSRCWPCPWLGLPAAAPRAAPSFRSVSFSTLAAWTSTNGRGQVLVPCHSQPIPERENRSRRTAIFSAPGGGQAVLSTLLTVLFELRGAVSPPHSMSDARCACRMMGHLCSFETSCCADSTSFLLSSSIFFYKSTVRRRERHLYPCLSHWRRGQYALIWRPLANSMSNCERVPARFHCGYAAGCLQQTVH